MVINGANQPGEFSSVRWATTIPSIIHHHTIKQHQPSVLVSVPFRGHLDTTGVDQTYPFVMGRRCLPGLFGANAEYRKVPFFPFIPIPG